MSTDLESQIATALIDAAATTTVDDDALAAILRRANTPDARHRPSRWMIVGGFTAAAAVTAIFMVNSNQSSAPPNLAFIQMPSMGSAVNDCGTVDQRPASPAETAQVAYLPDTLPDGYSLSDQAPSAMVQHRAASSVDCWSADTTYVDNQTGRLLTATVGRQGNEPQAECQLPDGYLPAECIAIGGRPAAISHQGTVATISWVTVDNDFASLSGYGFTTEELVNTATSVSFDGANVSLTPPMAMTLIENQPKTRDDNRDVTYFNATFASADDATPPIQLSVTTWNNTSINQVGPATTIDIDGTTAVVVTTGGPGTGITGWTSDPSDASSVNNAVPLDLPARAYVTWTSNGATFRIEGSDSATLIEIARHLRPA
jgi:hypothetical protein